MFNAQVMLLDDKMIRHNITVYTDTLYEAEIYVTKVLSNMYQSHKIILVYNYELFYFLYDGKEHIGNIQIIMKD